MHYSTDANMIPGPLEVTSFSLCRYLAFSFVLKALKFNSIAFKCVCFSFISLAF